MKNFWKQLKKETLNHILAQIDEKIFNLNLLVAKQNKIQNDQLEQRVSTIANSLSEIQEALQNEKKERERSATTLYDQIQGEILKFEEAFVIEQKVREETKNKIFSMIEEMNNKLVTSIDIEKREREETNESLLRLLEGTCTRIERTFR